MAPVLKPVTRLAKDSISGQDFILIDKNPFRFGRECRQSKNIKKFLSSERRLGTLKPNNDFYLLDFGKRLQISREHFLIAKDNDGYIICDRSSTCGLIVNSQRIHSEKGVLETSLNDGDKIVVGNKRSDYIFKFFASYLE